MNKIKDFNIIFVDNDLFQRRILIQHLKQIEKEINGQFEIKILLEAKDGQEVIKQFKLLNDPSLTTFNYNTAIHMCILDLMLLGGIETAKNIRNLVLKDNY